MCNLNFCGAKRRANSMAAVPSRGYNSASGTLFHMTLTEDKEQKLRKTMLDYTVISLQVTRIKWLFLAQLKKRIVTKQHFSRKE